ncbi:MAG: hypothetical protein GX879_11610, partial [Bacteroidales bacterium]|nr:hypothetical protein [Bacteroidales bacterium]
HELSVMLSKNFLYDALHTEMAVAYKFNTKEFMFRPGVSYAINDNLSVGLGAFFLYGPEETLNSYASKVLNSLFFQIKANF